MKKGWKILLVTLLLFSMMPWQFVQGAMSVGSEFGNYYGKRLASQDKVTVADLDKDATAAGMDEVVADRTENSKTFVNKDTGEGKTYYFTEPVHFKDSATGKWQDFDTTLVKDGAKVWTASETARPIVTPKIVTEDVMPTLGLDGADVAVRPSGDGDLTQIATQDNRILYASDDAKTDAFTMQADSFGMELGQYVKTGDETAQSVAFDLTVPDGVTLKDDAKRAATLIYRGKTLIFNILLVQEVQKHLKRRLVE
ncbi:hypothetical protein [Listeria grandensis]|uniref:hypothetical protein n=1 Tax=Listeria grandensis TaxID=1494963 RepID=UPI0021AB20AE|nr:hypothetical protein [Listeria grandensis]